MAKDSAWECECGNIEYGESAPEECEKCFKIESFAQLPEELLDERAKELAEEDLDIVPSVKSLKKPTKPRLKPKKKRK